MIPPFLKTLMMVPVFAALNTIQIVAPSFPQDTQDVPLDGGICILMAAGIGYGLKKTNTQNKIGNSKNQLNE